MAARQAELGFLANPAASHVQTAEMGKQSVNSLALLSARYTHTALDVLSQLAAAYLFVLFQALDLRVLRVFFIETLLPAFEAATKEILATVLGNVDPLHAQLWLHFNGLISAICICNEMPSAHNSFLYITLRLECRLLGPPPCFNGLAAVQIYLY